ADDKSKRQGQPNPPLTATYSGFVAGDSPASLDTPVTLATTATVDSPPGSYPITASGASHPNYAITYVPGTLRVLPELELAVPPFSQTRFVGQTATFAVQAGGSPPFTYQWCFQAAPIPGATGSTFSLSSLQLSNAGPYSVIVASSSGSVTSPPAQLTMLPRPAGPGSLDISFDPTAGGQLIGPAQGKGRVKTLALQPDGKLLVGGDFVGLQGKARNNLARLQLDGSLDQSFSPGFGTDGSVDDIAVQPDGRILIVGAFTRFNGELRSGIARLHPDGSLDASFHPAVGGYPVACLALQSDGKILIGGSFTNVCGASRRVLARLNPDGTLDAGFDAAPAITSATPWVAALALQPDGKVLVAGQFATALDRPLARLNPDGSLDASFATPQIRDTSTVGWVNTLAIDPSGRILIGGHFLSVNGISRQGLARLSADGALDTTFLAGPLGGTQDIGKIVLQPDGKVLIGGSFLAINGIIRHGLARLNADGTVDLSFDAADAVYEYASVLVNDLVLDSVGRVVVASGLSEYWARSPHPLCRLNPNGALDTSFLEPVLPQAGAVNKVAVQADGKVLVLLPEYASFNGQPCGPVVRLRPDGTLDSTFASPLVGGDLHCVLVQPDGKILLGGSHFLLTDDTEFIGVIRLNSDGSFDTAFQADSPGDYSVAVYSLALQPDGRILVNGVFDTIRRVERSFVARLNPDGSIDESFQLDPQLQPSLGEFDPPLNCVAVQSDGKILLGGWFGLDETVPRLVRLNADGSLDRDLLTPSQTGG
ncbi:MAG TPA: MBG domain-containing protein, partial [Bacillota bacterium]|nr:MBG domain-containing protein [Bacillota bacterium]